MSKLLTISMLVCGREDTMWKSLDSLKPIMDAIPSELILVDTGCSKDVREKLKQYTDKIIPFTWCNDFAKARNVALEAAEGEWFMYLDDDEWFTDCKEIILFFQKGIYKKFGFASYIQRNFLDEEGIQYTDSWAGRMAKITPELRFSSRIHEHFVGREGEGMRLKAVVDHYGYCFKDEESKLRHFERNHTLIMEMIKEEPENLRWGMQLVQEYRAIESYADMIHWGNLYLEKAVLHNRLDSIKMEECFYGAIILGYFGKKDYEKAVSIAKEIRQTSYLSRLCKSMAFQVAARARYEQGRYDKSIIWCERYLENYEFFQEDEAELFIQQGYPFVSEAMDIVKWKEVYSIAMCAGLRLGDATNLEKYWRKLKWEEKNAYIFEDMANTVIEAFEKMPYQEVFYHLASAIWKHSALKNYFIEEISAREIAGENIKKAVAVFKQVDEAEKIKAQIQMLLDKGLTEQVEQLLPQIKAMLPYDEEIKGM